MDKSAMNLTARIAALKAGNYDELLQDTKYKNATKGTWKIEDDGDDQRVKSTFPLTDENRKGYHPSYTEGCDTVCCNTDYYPTSVREGDMVLIADAKQLAATVVVQREVIKELVSSIDQHPKFKNLFNPYGGNNTLGGFEVHKLKEALTTSKLLGIE